MKLKFRNAYFFKDKLGQISGGKDLPLFYIQRENNFSLMDFTGIQKCFNDVKFKRKM